MKYLLEKVYFYDDDHIQHCMQNVRFREMRTASNGRGKKLKNVCDPLYTRLKKKQEESQRKHQIKLEADTSYYTYVQLGCFPQVFNRDNKYSVKYTTEF